MLLKDKTYKELHQTLNMSQAEFRAWLMTDLAPITVANYPDAPSMDKSKKLLQIMGKDKEELTTSDCQFVKIILLRIHYLKRIKSKEQYRKLDWENSLRNMGYDIKKEARKLEKQVEY
ncbi:DUF3140 domain-containing protein [Flavimarina sp. Hel_I_48]|uniref:DUF3140 domain-containing protein n=1 Tax=Flavimarina sp. Hel_I_48 TaxID=1392488 RepID=UPI0004DF5A47|nr:DUF3140 domain-containing protein [Flavimarina sp. Hel_I_48]